MEMSNYQLIIMKNAIQEQAEKLIEEANEKAEQMANEATKKAQQIADEARKKAENLRKEAERKARQLREKAAEKVETGKREIVKAGKSATERFLTAGAVSLGAILFAKFLLGEYSTWAHSKEVNQELDAAIKREEENGNKLSFSWAQFRQFAGMIEAATNGVGTDTQVIMQVFSQLKNNADVLALIKVYGRRQNTYFGIPMGRYTLNQLLINELSNGERADLNALLQNKKITIKF